MIWVHYQHSIFIDLYGFHPYLGVNQGLMFHFICIYGTFLGPRFILLVGLATLQRKQDTGKYWTLLLYQMYIVKTEPRNRYQMYTQKLRWNQYVLKV